MTTETTKTLTRDLPNGSRIVATLAIRDLGTGPYFSLTGEVYDRHGTWSGAARQRNGREPDACGQVTEELLRAFPSLASFERMHLANAETGEPMYAVANGFYFYSGDAEEHERRHYGDDYARRHGTGYERACRALRVDAIPPDLDRDGFERFADEQRPRWAEEAAAARATVAGGPAGQTDHDHEEG